MTVTYFDSCKLFVHVISYLDLRYDAILPEWYDTGYGILETFRLGYQLLVHILFSVTQFTTVVQTARTSLTLLGEGHSVIVTLSPGAQTVGQGDHGPPIVDKEDIFAEKNWLCCNVGPALFSKVTLPVCQKCSASFDGDD